MPSYLFYIHLLNITQILILKFYEIGTLYAILKIKLCKKLYKRKILYRVQDEF
jgi:hypothetical protein